VIAIDHANQIVVGLLHVDARFFSAADFIRMICNSVPSTISSFLYRFRKLIVDLSFAAWASSVKEVSALMRFW
jgi:hypothetical protein